MKKLTFAFLMTVAVLAAQVAVSNPPGDTNYLPNDGSTGTTTGYWMMMNASGNAVLAPTTVTSGVRGLCITGCGTTGMAGFISRGVWPGFLDNAGTPGHWVIPSPTTDGKGHDTGSASRPASGPVYGQVSQAAPGGMYYVALDPPDMVANGGGDPGSVTPAMMGASTYPALTDGATVTWAIASVLNAQAVLTFTAHSGSRALNITNPVIGGNYVLKLVQDSTGGEGLTLGTGCTWKVANNGGGLVTLSSTASALDLLTFTYDGTNCLAVLSTKYN